MLKMYSTKLGSFIHNNLFIYVYDTSNYICVCVSIFNYKILTLKPEGVMKNFPVLLFCF